MANIRGTNARDTLVGAGQNDSITGQGGDDLIIGGLGNDSLDGGNDADTLHGEAGNDLLVGGNGRDLLRGGAGNDIINGGNDIDAAVFTGLTSQYLVTRNGNGSWTVRDLVAGRDGIDTVTSVERLRFADGTIYLVANRGPSGVNDSAALREDITLVASGNLLANDSDADGDRLSVVAIARNGSAASTDGTAGLVGAYGQLTWTSAGAWTYRLANDSPAVQALRNGQRADDIFNVTISDGEGGFVTTRLTVAVTGTNDAPVVAAPLAGTVAEGSAPLVLNLLQGATDADAGETATLAITGVTYAVNGGVASTTPPAGFSRSGANLTINAGHPAYDSLAQGETRVITVSYTVQDAQGATVAQTATVTITGTNDAPTVGAAVSLPAGIEDQAVQITAAQLLAGASDVDGEPLLVSGLIIASGGGTLVANAGGWLYTPAANANGTVTFAYTVSDGLAGVAQGATLVLAAVNDAPTGSLSIAGMPEVGATLSAISTLDDPDGLGAVTYTWLRDGLAVATGATYLLTAADAGTEVSVTASWTDGGGTAEAVASGALLVTGDDNAAPVALDVIAVTGENAAILDATFDASDADADTLTYELVGPVPAGISLTAGGTAWSFDPGTGFDALAAGESAQLVFAYRAFDGTAYSAPASVAITVLGVNDAPLLAAAAGLTDYVEGGAAVALAAASVADAELDARNGGLGDYAGASVTLARSGGAVAEDAFGFDTAGAAFEAAGGLLLAGGLAFGSYALGGGALTITFDSAASAATSALVDQVLARLTYAGTAPLEATPDPLLSLALRFDDGSGAPDAVAAATLSVAVTNVILGTEDFDSLATPTVGRHLVYGLGSGDDLAHHAVASGGGLVDGGDGDDFASLYGTAAAESWSVAAAPGGAMLSLGGVATGIQSVEYLSIFTQGGGDDVTIADIGATGTLFVSVAGDAGDNLLDASALSVAANLSGGEGGEGGADTLRGGMGADALAASGGGSLLQGGAGSDALALAGAAGGATLDGGAEEDSARIVGSTAAEAWTLQHAAPGLLVGIAGGTVLALSVEALALDAGGGEGGDSFVVGDLSASGVQSLSALGDGGDNLIDATAAAINATLDGGLAGADTLRGGAGADELLSRGAGSLVSGGDGDDRLAAAAGGTLDGGAGFDSATIAGTAAAETWSLSDGGGQVVLDVNGAPTALAGIEQLFLAATQGGGDSVVIGDLSATTLIYVQAEGDAGDNLLDGSAAGIALGLFDGAGGADTLLGGAGADQLQAVGTGSRLSGGQGDDSLVSLGTGLALAGDAGNDTASSNGAADTLSGGDGDDELAAFSGQGHLLAGGDGTDRLFAYGGANTLDGGAGDDTIVLGGGGNLLAFTTGHGQDVLHGITGSDVLLLAGFGPDLDSFADVLAASVQSDGDTVIATGAGSVIILAIVDRLSLTADNFIFA
jgi:VCBS repeat-containing protein